jgi:uncharacterized membrane protein (UPF0127 family)
MTMRGLRFLPLLVLASLAARAQSVPLEELSQFPQASLEISGAPGAQKHSFQVWIADTPARQEQGLMFVRDLAADRGMLFPQTPPRVMNMWMKNTYVELDMVFVGTDGRIVRILERAKPLTLDTLSSGQPVAAVLEIRGGEASRRGLRLGDRVSWAVAH